MVDDAERAAASVSDSEPENADLTPLPVGWIGCSWQRCGSRNAAHVQSCLVAAQLAERRRVGHDKLRGVARWCPRHREVAVIIGVGPRERLGEGG
jgi:hypothetical protein